MPAINSPIHSVTFQSFTRLFTRSHASHSLAHPLARIRSDTTFCFLCGKAISGYDHFNLENGDVTCRGQLFDMADLVDFVHQRAFQRRGPAVPRVERDWNAPQQFCIRCGQLANKVANNNHMRCAACHTAWCYLCRHELRGRGAAARHFGPSKCHQHTPG